MYRIIHLSFILVFLISFNPKTWAQVIPDEKVLEIAELPAYLKAEKRNQLSANGPLNNEKLAQYFRESFSSGFFYDYKTFYDRLSIYQELYANEQDHKTRALDHLQKYSDAPRWKLPFQFQNGTSVDAYSYRHLARQHKMVDIALLYFNEDKDPKYIRYFSKQMQSLNTALEANAYETIEDGNGVYEVFRAGYRIFNWLWIHNMFLGEAAYTDEDQLHTIATLLQHGQHLYERNGQFRPGNHQTKGMSALAVLSILLSDFAGTEKWYDRAMLRLGEHLDKEINPDGFQFERSVHYHMSDINNYFFVYQLAKINDIEVDKNWEQKLRTLFTTLVKIAYPDKSAPVLQDDTEIPWGEKNDISGAMTLGYLLFEDPEFGYFASDQVDDRMYWYLSNDQVEKLNAMEQKRPNYGSLAFEDTHYYVMRQGWEPKDKMMIVSAGLDTEKPDHQHGDMLGIQAIANGQVILPNYQVRYSLKDFELFKNSMVKNVALVDEVLQGREWTSNKGGSGFGKFKKLPNPKVIAWETKPEFDFFVGSHDGFEDSGVSYSRQVLYIKDDFWIVKDNFQSESSHEYKQVWQGHYTTELGPNLIRSSFPDASGADILQLNAIDTFVTSGARGKSWTVLSKKGQQNFEFLTVIFPYKGYSKRIDETTRQIQLKDWTVNGSSWEISGNNPRSLSRQNQNFCFGIQEMTLEDITIQADSETDLYVALKGTALSVYLLGDKATVLKFRQEKGGDKATSISLKPGDHYLFNLK
ncbi:MAG: hypothetical protein Sapg2KO_21230 [Saprospiraceae bacterium]